MHPPSLRKSLYTKSEFLSIYYLRVTLDVPIYSSIRVQSGTIRLYGYHLLLVINCTRGRILHHFRDNLRRVKMLAKPDAFNPDGWVSWDISVQFCMDDRVQNGV